MIWYDMIIILIYVGVNILKVILIVAFYIFHLAIQKV